MRILIAHNHYQQAGGEDDVFAAEAALLERYGHDVHRYALRNDGLEHANPVALARDAIWNQRSYREIQALVRRFRPDVVHFHNTLPRISPAAYHAASRAGVPVVQTVHNYRLVCPNAMLFRDGRPCHECVGRTLGVSGIVHRCYRGSRAASAAVAGMTAAHHVLGTWKRSVTLYVALTEFARQRLIEGGFAAEQIVVKPNFVDPDPGPGAGSGGYALFVGRLSPEKGIRTLLEAWRTLHTELPLLIVGDGPLAGEVEEVASARQGVRWLGRQTPDAVARIVGDATMMVCPSGWYEACPRVVLEAFAAGTPVLASDLGALAELVQDGRTGRLFQPRDAESLVRVAREMSEERETLRGMRIAARGVFEQRFGAATNHELLMDVYRTAIGRTV